MSTNKVAVVFCHSRAKLLDKCLLSLKAANENNSWKIVVVRQAGFNSVEKVLVKHKGIIDYLITLKPNHKFPLGNINYNRYLGTDFAFTILDAKIVLGIEEDNLVSKDSLKFIDFANEKYRRHLAFRGINLGSVEHGSEIDLKGYSLLRFGIHGSAGALTKRSWNYIKRNKLLNFDFNETNRAWDAEIEFYLKSGFMVTPNLSRNLDLGYGGTFAPSSRKNPYFVNITKSWVGKKDHQGLQYRHAQITHDWRFDSVAYRKKHSFVFFFRRYKRFNKIASLLKIKGLLKNTL